MIGTRTLREKKKTLWKMKVTVIPIFIGASCTVTKKLLQGLANLEIRERVETTYTRVFLGKPIIRATWLILTLLGPPEDIIPGFYLLWLSPVYHLTPEAPILGNYLQSLRYFWCHRTYLSYSPAPGSLAKKPFCLPLLGYQINTEKLISQGPGVFQPAVFFGMRISSVLS